MFCASAADPCIPSYFSHDLGHDLHGIWLHRRALPASSTRLRQPVCTDLVLLLLFLLQVYTHCCACDIWWAVGGRTANSAPVQALTVVSLVRGAGSASDDVFHQTHGSTLWGAARPNNGFRSSALRHGALRAAGMRGPVLRHALTLSRQRADAAALQRQVLVSCHIVYCTSGTVTALGAATWDVVSLFRSGGRSGQQCAESHLLWIWTHQCVIQSYPLPQQTLLCCLCMPSQLAHFDCQVVHAGERETCRTQIRPLDVRRQRRPELTVAVWPRRTQKR